MSEVQVIKATTKLVDRNKPKGDKRMRVAAYCRVSTDKYEQANSFKSQVDYYTEMITKNPEWSFAGIYADEGISGAHADNRPDFMRLIKDCMEGKIDVIMIKSVSRMGRNTLDNIKYIKMLKEKGISIRFEEEHCDSLSEMGDFMLTLMSSMAQQELINTSQHTKKGLKMKMGRGELVGFNSCFGYDYDKETKKMSINKKEAESVKYIFKRYIEGAGTSVITRELMEKGVISKSGAKKWYDTTVLAILKNEKYKGDLLQGKTFTGDPLSKKRFKNYGEEDKFYVSDHHEPIVSKEVWDQAKEIRLKRTFVHRRDEKGRLTEFSKKHTFSSTLECGFCGHLLTRRAWHSGANYHKVIWQCVGYAKHGKHVCPYCKGIPENVLQECFVEAYNNAFGNNTKVIEELIQRAEATLTNSIARTNAKRLDSQISTIQKKINKSTDLLLEGSLTQENYDEKNKAWKKELADLQGKRDATKIEEMNLDETESRLNEFKDILSRNRGKPLNEFSDAVYLSVVEKVIIGKKDEQGKVDPYHITFVFKKPFDNDMEVPTTEVVSDNEPISPLVNNAIFSQHPINDYATKSNSVACRDGGFDVQTQTR